MKLLVDKSFSGVLGNAGKGRTIEVPAAVGKKMIASGYPVTEVKASGRRNAGKPEGKPDTQ